MVTAQTPTFKTNFIASVASVLGISSTCVTIVSMSASRRQLLAGVVIVYDVAVANVPASVLQTSLGDAITSGTFTAALQENTGITTIGATTLPTIIDMSPTSAPTAAPESAPTPLNVGAIAGGVGGGIAAVALCAVLYWCLVKKRSDANGAAVHSTGAPIAQGNQ